jgi:prepilin-type N-terminal cleavage/methylation domain-containing protein
MTRKRYRTLAERRRGFTLFEVAMAALMLGIAMTVTVQLAGWVAAERRSAGRRGRAVQEAANVMERLAALPWDRLTPETAADASLSPAARQALPGGELKADVAAHDEDGGSRRIRVQVRWRDRSGKFEAPVRLTSWVYHRGRARP